jgi:hypothetical protein
MDSMDTNQIANNSDNNILIGSINIINANINVININNTKISSEEDESYSDLDIDPEIVYVEKPEKFEKTHKKPSAKKSEKEKFEKTHKKPSPDKNKNTREKKSDCRKPPPRQAEQRYHISEQQIKAVKEIVEEFEQRRRWVILTAQMQSGKTTTYYLTATVMLMKRLVDKVIIFSGNNENELKIQINEDKNQLISHLIREPACLNTFDNNMNIYELTHYIRENLIVLWGGHDMKKYEGHQLTDRVLYIWDESHAAQDKKNIPAKFLKDRGISGCGYQDNMEEQQSYMLSVSATPFSEISDNKHENQSKSIVNLEVDDNLYHGVKKMIEKGLIKSYHYNNWKEHLVKTLNHHKRQEPKYALIRLRENRVVSGHELIRIITDAGWNYLTFDSSKDSDLADTTKLKVQPRTHTVVILKGKCRMGKVVPKQFIAFCMETSKKSKTDVILQGLLGRMCGYAKPGTPIYEVEIHLSHHVFENINDTNEFEKYIEYIQSNDTIPHRAKNILSGEMRTRSKYYPIIPIRIRFDEHYDYNRNNICSKVIQLFRQKNINDCNDNINDCNDNISDYNNNIQKCELFDRFDRIDDKTIKVRYIDNNNENAYIQADIPNKIHDLISSRKNERVHLSYSGTKRKNELNEEIILWVFKTSFEEYGIMQGDIFVDAETKTTIYEMIARNEGTEKIPSTTKKEVFCDRDHDEIRDYVENDTDCESGYDTDGTSLDS